MHGFEVFASSLETLCEAFFDLDTMSRERLLQSTRMSDPPEGITIDSVSRFDEGAAILLRGDAEKAKPGLRGNLIANASQQRTITDGSGKTREYRAVLGTLPAIPFEVVKPL